MKKLLTGNEAVVEAALRAECSFFAGYPISPSTEIAEKFAEVMPSLSRIFIQMEDEIASISAVIGASLTGAKAMTATSGPGFSLMQENIGFAYMAEVPCVIVNVQRGGPSTGLPTKPAQGDVMQAKWGTHGDHPAVVFCPSTVEEVYYETIRAFNWSEKLRIPVILLLDEVVAHTREDIEIPEEIELWEREKPERKKGKYEAYSASGDDIPKIPNFGEGYRFHVTGLFHDSWGFPTQDPEIVARNIERMMRKVRRFEEQLEKMELYEMDDAETVVISFGSTARSALRAIKMARKLGIKAGLIKLLTLWPSPEKKLRETIGKRKTLVVEMNMGQYFFEVQRILRDLAEVYSLSEMRGELLSPVSVLSKLKEIQTI